MKFGIFQLDIICQKTRYRQRDSTISIIILVFHFLFIYNKFNIYIAYNLINKLCLNNFYNKFYIFFLILRIDLSKISHKYINIYPIYVQILILFLIFF